MYSILLINLPVFFCKTEQKSIWPFCNVRVHSLPSRIFPRAAVAIAIVFTCSLSNFLQLIQQICVSFFFSLLIHFSFNASFNFEEIIPFCYKFHFQCVQCNFEYTAILLFPAVHPQFHILYLSAGTNCFSNNISVQFFVQQPKQCCNLFQY